MSTKALPPRFGQLARISALPGQRDLLIDAMLEGMKGAAGCALFLVAKDSNDGDLIWVTEVWESSEAHDVFLAQPGVQETAGRVRPLMATREVNSTEPVGGIGLPPR